MGSKSDDNDDGQSGSTEFGKHEYLDHSTAMQNRSSPRDQPVDALSPPNFGTIMGSSSGIHPTLFALKTVSIRQEVCA